MLYGPWVLVEGEMLVNGGCIECGLCSDAANIGSAEVDYQADHYHYYQGGYADTVGEVGIAPGVEDQEGSAPESGAKNGGEFACEIVDTHELAKLFAWA